MRMIIGPDVSEYSGLIDWENVRGARFAYCRVGTGKYGADEDAKALDDRAKHNWSGIGQRCPFTLDELLSHGIRRGGYYFPYIRQKGDGSAQGRQFVRLLRSMPGEIRKTDFVVVDVEDQKEDPCWSKLGSARARRYELTAFMAEIEDHLDRRGLCYGGEYFMRDLFGEDYVPDVGTSHWKTIVPNYDSTPVWLPTPFVERMLLWQHAGDGVGAEPKRVDGIGADVDVNRVVNATESGFMHYGLGR
jgi:GH25 family lysozyme M1 (1,4-beta-N-acetylmuramidase)